MNQRLLRLGILFLALAVLLRVDFIFYVAYVCLGMVAWSRWFVPRALKNLKISRDFENRAFPGEELTVRIVAENKGSWRIPWLQFSDSVPLQLRISAPKSIVTDLAGKERKIFEYQIKALQRGYYRLGPMWLQTGDLFGFFRQDGQLPPAFLTVYPRIFLINKLGLPSRLPFGTLASRQPLFEDPARPVGVRPYQAGDSLRRVNWKVSAHNNGLLTKRLQPAISLETMLILNLNIIDFDRRARYNAPEWGIELAASLAASLIDQKQAVGLLANGADPLLSLPGNESADGVQELPIDPESGRALPAALPSGAYQTEYQLGHALGKGARLVPPPIPLGTGRGHLMKILEQLARLDAEDTVHFAHWLPLNCAGLNWGVTLLIIAPNAGMELCQALHRLARSGYNPVLLAIEPQADAAKLRQQARYLGFSAFVVTKPEDLYLND